VPVWSWDEIMPVQVIFADRVVDPGGSQRLMLWGV
jgi:hypothetical protein